MCFIGVGVMHSDVLDGVYNSMEKPFQCTIYVGQADVKAFAHPLISKH